MQVNPTLQCCLHSNISTNIHPPPSPPHTHTHTHTSRLYEWTRWIYKFTVITCDCRELGGVVRVMVPQSVSQKIMCRCKIALFRVISSEWIMGQMGNIGTFHSGLNSLAEQITLISIREWAVFASLQMLELTSSSLASHKSLKHMNTRKLKILSVQ